jgi:hypothetical protein
MFVSGSLKKYKTSVEVLAGKWKTEIWPQLEMFLRLLVNY